MSALLINAGILNSQTCIEIFGNPKLNQYGKLVGNNVPSLFQRQLLMFSYEFGISYRLMKIKNNSFFIGLNYSMTNYIQKQYANNSAQKDEIINHSSYSVYRWYKHVNYRLEKNIFKRNVYADLEFGINFNMPINFQINSNLYYQNNNETVDTFQLNRTTEYIKRFLILGKLEIGTKIKIGKSFNLLAGVFYQYGAPQSRVHWVIYKNNVEQGNFYHYRSNTSFGLSIKYQLDVNPSTKKTLHSKTNM